MIYACHYFPCVNQHEVTGEEFAQLSEEALWLYEQVIISRMFPVTTPHSSATV
ncbi:MULTISPECIES: hypothetical protein [Bacteroidaceae]|uniref:hypothetical protein n=1 Tax=Bacteroidaceae TaxID=815 RepID=UPI003DA437B6